MKKQKIYLEHINITVSNLQKSIKFFQTAFPHFKIRGGGSEMREWVHLGDDDRYFAINQAKDNPIKAEKNYDRNGINHLGFVVEDVENIALNLLEKGYKRCYPKQVEQFRIREHFTDKDGNEFEFVQYLSDVAEEENRYDV